MDFRGLFLPPGARAGPSRAQAPSLGDREGVPPLPRLTACAARVIPLPRDQPSMRHSPAQLAARQKPMAHTPSASSRSEKHTSEIQSLMRISYAVFCLKKKKNPTHKTT